MASAMATAATRNIPTPYTISVGPRVRPPRLLPGTKAANTNPRPNESPPKPGHVWVQGKWRDPGSNAAKDRRQLESTQAEKALRHATHGMNIYAYSHMRTNQVVYSLSRVMQNNKILEQLIFHGKKTVPASLRRDMWRPYFSIHFDQSPAGAEAGLKAYRRLRELAIQRQLSPPEELITATEDDVKRSEAIYTPAQLDDKRRDRSLRDNTRGRKDGHGKYRFKPLKNMPVKNQMLPKKLRARKLMNQKATSVADAALVLSLVDQELSPAEALDVSSANMSAKHETWSSRALKRLNTIREKEAEKDIQIEERQQRAQSGEGQLGLTPHAAKRIAIEHGGAVRLPQKGMEYQVETPQLMELQQRHDRKSPLLTEEKPQEFDEQEYRAQYIESWKEKHAGEVEGPSTEDVNAAVSLEQRRVESQMLEYEEKLARAKGLDVTELRESYTNSKRVHVLWADLRDGAWVDRWSNNVWHGELEPRAALKQEKVLFQQQITIDEEGNEVSEQQRRIMVQSSTTPHIFGTDANSLWYQTPAQLTEERQNSRIDKAAAWQEEKLQLSKEIIQRMDAAHQDKSRGQNRARDIQPEINATNQAEEQVADDQEINTPAEAAEYEVRTSVAKAKNSIARADQRLQALEKEYPMLYGKFAQLLEWRQGLETYAVLSDIKTELDELKIRLDSEDAQLSKRLQQIDRTLTQHSANQEHLEALISPNTDVVSIESELLTIITKSKQRIAQYEQRITALEATNPESPELKEARSLLQNEHDVIWSSREDGWSRRTIAIEDTLSAISRSRDYRDTGVIDLIQQRMYAQRSGDTQGIESLSEELKERENDKLASLLGFEPEVQTRVYELDERAREKGLEMPPPPESRGVWVRIKGVFGR